MWIWLLAAALAQDTYEADYELVVTAEREIAEAWDAVEQAAKELGYRRGVTLGERHHLIHAQPWKGRVMIHEQGFARIHVPWLIPLGPAPETEAPVSVTFLMNGKRVRLARKISVAQALEPELKLYRDALSRRAQGWRLLELHAQLDRVWEAGLAPDGATVGDPAARRAWLMSAWENTSDTPEGAAVRERIAQFIVHRVQVSDHPFDEAELRDVLESPSR